MIATAFFAHFLALLIILVMNNLANSGFGKKPTIELSQKQADKKRLKLIVSGTDVQKNLSETIKDDQGNIKPKYTRDNPLKLRPTVTGYREPSGDLIIKIHSGQNHFIRHNVNGWTEKNIGKLIDMTGFVRQLEAFGFPGNNDT